MSDPIGHDGSMKNNQSFGYSDDVEPQVLYLVNDRALPASCVTGALAEMFESIEETEASGEFDRLCESIVEDVRRHGEAPCLTGDFRQVAYWRDHFAGRGIPVRMADL